MSDVLQRLQRAEAEILWLKRRATRGGGGMPPSAHAARHADGGSDEVDITALGGFPGGGTTFLRDDGTFATPPGSGLLGTVGAWLVTIGDVVFVQCPYGGTIISCVIAGYDADGSPATGDAEVDILKDTEENYPPDGSDSIVASAPPTLSSQSLVRDSTLSEWSAAVAAGDWFVFELVDSDVDKVLVALTILRS